MNIYAAIEFLESCGLLQEYYILPDKVEIVLMLEGTRRMIHMTYEQVFRWVAHAQKRGWQHDRNTTPNEATSQAQAQNPNGKSFRVTRKPQAIGRENPPFRQDLQILLRPGTRKLARRR